MPQPATLNEHGARSNRRRCPALRRYDGDLDLVFQDMKRLMIVRMALPWRNTGRRAEDANCAFVEGSKLFELEFAKHLEFY